MRGQKQRRPQQKQTHNRRDIFVRAEEQAQKRLVRAEEKVRYHTDQLHKWSTEIPRLRRILEAFGSPTLDTPRTKKTSFPLTPGEQILPDVIPQVPEQGEDQFLKD